VCRGTRTLPWPRTRNPTQLRVRMRTTHSAERRDHRRHFSQFCPAFEGPDLPCSGSPRSRRMYLPLSGGGWVVAPSAGVCFWNPWPAESGNATRSDQVPLPVHPRVASSPCLQSRCSAGSRSFPCLRGGLNPRPTLCVVCRKAFDDSEPRLQCVNPGGQIPT
jgi:hypothetical protein